MGNLAYLFAALAVAWVLIFAYLYRLFQKQRELEAELALLAQQLASRTERNHG